MAKQKKEGAKTSTRKKASPRLKKGFKLYPLKKATMIGDTLRPVGYKIALSEDGYKFHKSKNRV